jgi:D-alanyl-D-alanine carboxypeptidase/D-alanyl-D-alanine-endopeptidase (penicillin-binding protein 4)
MRRAFFIAAFLLPFLFPVPVPDSASPVRAAAELRPLPEVRALAEFKRRLIADGRDPSQHGVYVETLNEAQAVAALNENLLFNPASVAKLATSLAALDKLGANYRFRTELRAVGEIDARTGELQGDLILVSSDPSFSLQDARNVGDGLRRLGIRRVRGDLVVMGAFTCNHNSQTDVSTGVFRRHARLAMQGAARYESAPGAEPPGRLLLAVESDTLIRILQQQNAHSINSMADILGDHIGGAEAIRKFLVERLRLPEEAVYLSHASGLDVNRITPRGTVKVLCALVRYLAAQGYPPEAIMPVAGIDSGTLRTRFADEEFAGSIVAKTGTLHDTDGGVAALAGVAYTRARGPLLFVIYDMAESRHVMRLRRMQDDFLRDLIIELGGPAPLANHTENALDWAPESRLILNARQ